jgi:hypothetical protein
MPDRVAEATKAGSQRRSPVSLSLVMALAPPASRMVPAYAQVSAGRVHISFATREELLVALLREAPSSELDAGRASVSTAPQTRPRSSRHHRGVRPLGGPHGTDRLGAAPGTSQPGR